MKKSKVKKIFSIICLLVMSCLVFSGCASVHYSVVVTPDGSVQQGFQVSLDKSKITLAGYDYTDVADKINQVFLDKQHILDTAKFAYQDRYKNTDGIEIIYEVANDFQDFYLAFRCSNIEIYKKYTSIVFGSSSDSDDSSSGNIEENAFFIKDISENHVFSGLDNKDADGNYTNSIVKAFTDYFDGSAEGTQKFTLDDVQYNFYYGVPTTKLHSNSDHIISQSGVEIHQWVFDSTNLNDPIQTWTISIKPVAWYVLALVLTFILIIILFIICLIKKKSKKIQNTIAQEENS